MKERERKKIWGRVREWKKNRRGNKREREREKRERKIQRKGREIYKER
jgi:hypothetical protein